MSYLQNIAAELRDEIQTLKRKLHILERNHELQSVALDEEKRKSTMVLVSLQ